MLAILYALGMFIVDRFKSRSRLEAENLFLRHQLNLALGQKPPRVRLLGSDRALLVWMVRLWPCWLGVVQITQPETILRWHRAGFRSFWRWMSEEGRAAKDRSRAARIDPAHEHGEFALGCLTDPRRAVDAGFRSRSVDGVEIHGATTQTTVSNLEDVSAQRLPTLRRLSNFAIATCPCHKPRRHSTVLWSAVSQTETKNPCQRYHSLIPSWA